MDNDTDFLHALILRPGRWDDYLKWKHSQRERAQSKEYGIHCRICNFVHPYNGRGKVAIDAEKQNGRWIILWVCPVSGMVIGELAGGVTYTNKVIRTISPEGAQNDELPAGRRTESGPHSPPPPDSGERRSLDPPPLHPPQA